MSKFKLAVNFTWEAKGQQKVTITRSEFNDLQELLKRMSDSRFEFYYKTKSLELDNLEIIPDPEISHLGTVWSRSSLPPAAERVTRLQMLEQKVERILVQAEDLKSEIKCIRKGD